MGYPSAEAIDLLSTLEQALDNASCGLNRAAAELGAESVAVLLAVGSRVEVTYFWSSGGDPAPSQGLQNAAQNDLELVKTKLGLVESGSPLAQLLREWISPNSRSFLLFPWQVQRRSISVVFCFKASTPPQRDLPDLIRERLDLIGLATWSVKEIARLRTELKIVTSRLAGRKLVERAKSAVQVDQGITEERAYDYLRQLSRRRRITLVALAEEVLRGRGERGEREIAS
jgi:ANTAR domain